MVSDIMDCGRAVDRLKGKGIKLLICFSLSKKDKAIDLYFFLGGGVRWVSIVVLFFIQTSEYLILDFYVAHFLLHCKILAHLLVFQRRILL